MKICSIVVAADCILASDLARVFADAPEGTVFVSVIDPDLALPAREDYLEADLAAVRTRAEPQPDGTFKIFGTKIYITYGEHDMAENIVHLVLARLPDAPPGPKGLSLFLFWQNQGDYLYASRERNGRD